MLRGSTPAAAVFIVIVLALGSANPASASGCHAEDEQVKVSGRIVVLNATNEHTGSPYTYPVLRLDKAICYQSKVYGDVPTGAKIALIPSDDKAQRLFIGKEGERITVRGTLEHAITTDQPPQALLLFDPVVVRP